MDNKIKSAIKNVLALTAASTIVTATSALAEQKTEKCYGIVKAGLNDCQTNTQSCAGSSVKDNQPDAFIFLPTGVCNKIVGGSLKAKKAGKTK
jgi:uncharacterized membrane protein